MREAQFTKLLTIALSEASYQKIKEITDRDHISMAQWFRDATKLKLEQDELEENSNEK